ncbi:MAG: glycoside hydrolase family 3 N-terminal domain-containing protein, partial [Alphaproteobacteria bacterium]|nr:glycoside hydrolase family 3 N-terminal domain-containing protein [Alphaproteobacteria bacterium]
MKTAPVIFGCAGQQLSEAEHDFFARLQPCGFILFARNIEDPDQLSRLVGELKAGVEAEPLILIDQEGGRVARLKPPLWPLYRPWRDFGDLARHDAEAGARAAYLNARLIGDDLAQLGITVDCLPVLDVPVPGAHDIIGDRAFAEEPETVMQIGRKVCEGLMDSGVLPTIKHIPGHGRAGVDSHEALPRVTESREVLEKTDFAPFAALCDMPIAMTAHIVFEALDPAQPVTTSSTMIDLIRKDIGFDGL